MPISKSQAVRFVPIVAMSAHPEEPERLDHVTTRPKRKAMQSRPQEDPRAKSSDEYDSSVEEQEMPKAGQSPKKMSRKSLL